MGTFKVSPVIPARAILRRVSPIRRTVRYEWCDNGATVLAPVFYATLLEWERAVD